MLSFRSHAGVAAAIALAAFVIGQIEPGAGVAFVAAAAGMWTAYAVTRARRAASGD